MTTSRRSVSNPNLKLVVKTLAVALEAKGRSELGKFLTAAAIRNKRRQAVLAKWLWEQLFIELRNELAKPNRDIKKVATYVAAMRKLVPPPPGRNDRQAGFPGSGQLADQFATAFARARQRTAGEAAAEATGSDVPPFD